MSGAGAVLIVNWCRRIQPTVGNTIPWTDALPSLPRKGGLSKAWTYEQASLKCSSMVSTSGLRFSSPSDFLQRLWPGSRRQRNPCSAKLLWVCVFYHSNRKQTNTRNSLETLIYDILSARKWLHTQHLKKWEHDYEKMKRNLSDLY